MASTGEVWKLGHRPALDGVRDHYAWFTVALIALTVLPKLALLRTPVDSMDEAILLVYPEMMRDGLVPNRDFFTVYGPGNYTLLVLLYTVTGPSVIVTRLLAVAYQVAVVTGVMRLTAKSGRAASAAAGITSALVLAGPMLLANAWTGGLALTVWSFVLLRRGTGRSAFVSGVLAGLTTYWRFEMAVLQLAALPLIWRDRRALPYLAGVAVGVVPTLVHLTVAGRAVLDNIVFQRMGLSGQSDPSMVSPAAQVSLAILGCAVLALVVVAALQRDRMSLFTATFAVLLVPQATQRIDTGHVAAVACVVLPLAVASLVAALSDHVRVGMTHGWGIAVASVGVLAVALTGAFVAADPSGVPVTHRGRTLYASPSDVEAYDTYIDQTTRQVPPGSSLIVGGTDMSQPVANLITLYHLLPEYEVGTYYVEMPDGVANAAGSRLPGDIARADVLLLSETDPSYLLSSPPTGRGTDEANREVDARFCLVAYLPEGQLLTPSCR